MASGLLASHNEAYWGERKVYMRQTPNTNSHHRNFVPNPNPNPIQRKNHGGGPDHPQQHNRIQPPPHKEESNDAAPAAISDDSSSSFKRKPFDLGRHRETGGYVTYNISTYTKKELRDLKRRLISELEQVQTISTRIEVTEAPIERSTTTKKLLPPPPPPPPCAEMKKLASVMMSKCGQILNKVMKHKGAEWFNSPVDVVRLNLYDYGQIIKQPMDLGTAKTKLAKNLYPSAIEFADDVRLTFKNALIYNPEGHVVHKFAGQLLRLFESQFVPAHQKYEKQLAAISQQQQQQEQEQEKERQRGAVSSSSWSQPRPLHLPVPVPEPPMRVVVPPSPPHPHLSVKVDFQMPPQQKHPPTMTMAVVAKQPKPKAKDPNKRPMNMEEKEKLGSALANLPQAKAAHVLQIVQKRNVHTAQEGDEVEIDFELMDNETLWELDRLVCNWKKTMRKQEVAMSATTCIVSLPPPHLPPPHHCHFSSDDAIHKYQVADGRVEEEEAAAAVAMKKSKKLDHPCDEDVDIDIGEELPVTNYPSVEIVKDAAAGDDDSSSSSGSSSSSDSDSGSSSGSDSDDDDGAGSPAAGSRPRPLPTGN